MAALKTQRTVFQCVKWTDPKVLDLEFNWPKHNDQVASLCFWLCRYDFRVPTIIVKDIPVIIIIRLNSSTIDELGRWCLKVGGAGRCTAGEEVSMVTLKRPPPTWEPSHWRTQWNTYQPTMRLIDSPKGGWAGRKLQSLRANVLAKWACEW